MARCVARKSRKATETWQIEELLLRAMIETKEKITYYICTGIAHHKITLGEFELWGNLNFGGI
jgi:hypothetical protein